MSHHEVLVTDYVHPLLLTGLKSIGYLPTYAPEMSRVEMEELLTHFEGVVVNTRCAISRVAMEKAKHLKWIARLGSGLDIIDLKAAADLSISVFSAPEGNAQAVAEHAMAMLLCLANKLLSADRSIREGNWWREPHRGWEIDGKTIGIIGHGNNGSAFARLWKGWNVRVLAYDKYVHGFGNEDVEETSLEKLMQESDIISLHIPLTEETMGLVNESFLSKCKSGVVLINTSRGKNVDLFALHTALESGQVKGTCLDVLSHEPPSSGPKEFQDIFEAIYKNENVVLSPHIAGWTVESREKIAIVLLEKIKSFTTFPK